MKVSCGDSRLQHCVLLFCKTKVSEEHAVGVCKLNNARNEMKADIRS